MSMEPETDLYAFDNEPKRSSIPAASANSTRISDEKLREWQERYCLEGLSLSEIRTMVEDAVTLHLS